MSDKEEQWRELSSFVSSFGHHEVDMIFAVRKRNKWDVIEAYKDLQQDMKNILLWINGEQEANTTEEGDKV